MMSFVIETLVTSDTFLKLKPPLTRFTTIYIVSAEVRPIVIFRTLFQALEKKLGKPKRDVKRKYDQTTSSNKKTFITK